MKKSVLVLFVFMVQFSFGKTLFVSTIGNHVAPFSSWASAATTIQAAVDESNDGDKILVANGHYRLSSEISISKEIVLRGVNGPAVTLINGGGKKRCFNITAGKCRISGFSIINGYTTASGGGAYARTATPTFTNCVFSGNNAGIYGGGMYRGIAENCIFKGNSAIYGAGFARGVAEQCTFDLNVATGSGGGMHEGSATNCIFSNNSGNRGGGARMLTAVNCSFSNNISTGNGGGMNGGTAYTCSFNKNSAVEDGAGTYYVEVYNSTFTGNESTDDGGGMYKGKAYNCTLHDNSAEDGGGIYDGSAFNCTFIGNSATSRGGGIYEGLAENCILWNNTATGSGDNLFETTISNSCSPDLVHNVAGNSTTQPMFMDQNAGDYRLLSGSPCIDKGSSSAVFTTTDLAGNPRIMDGTVDMGAYEFYADHGDVDNDGLLNAWESRYFGTITAALSTADPDGDGHVNRDEQITGMDPTKTSSCFTVDELEHPESDRFVINWESVTGRVYQVHCSTNLVDGYEPLLPLIYYPHSSYTDRVHQVEDSVFYKVNVQIEE